MRGRTFGSAPGLWTLGLWCKERPWTWSAGLQPVMIRLECPDGRRFIEIVGEAGLWPSERCPACSAPEAVHRVIDVTVGLEPASPLCLLEETLLVPSLFGTQAERWRAIHFRWFPGVTTIDAAGTARKTSIAVAAILTHRTRAIAARPIVQRMLAMDAASLSPSTVRSMVRPLGSVSDRTDRIIATLDAYGTLHTPSTEPGPRGIGDVIGPYALAAVEAIALGRVVETDDPYLSRYVEWLKGRAL